MNKRFDIGFTIVVVPDEPSPEPPPLLFGEVGLSKRWHAKNLGRMMIVFLTART